MNSWSKEFTVILIAEYFTMLFSYVGIIQVSGIYLYQSISLSPQILKVTKLNSDT